MPALDQIRAETEAELAALLRRLNARARKKVLGALEAYGSIEAIPQAFWDALKREADTEAAALLLLLIVPAYTTTQKRIDRLPGIPRATATGIGDLVADAQAQVAKIRHAAREAAARIGAETVEYHVEGARERLKKAIDDEMGRLNTLPPGEATREVRRTVADVFNTEPPLVGGDKAEVNAVTNSTRAVSAGETAAANDESQRRNVAIDMKWRTETDGAVCKICRPLHGRPSIQWVDTYPSGPPAHVNCRCSLVPYFEPARQLQGVA